MLPVLEQYRLDGNPISCARYGSGHINETYLLVTDRPRLYILQRINHTIFKDVPALMQNIIAVTAHLRSLDPDPRHVLTLVPNRESGLYTRCEDGTYWRLYDYVLSSLCLDRAQSVADFETSGRAFGMFQNQLADFSADTLSETIPNFHNTVSRYAALRSSIRRNASGRAKEAAAEIDFALAREDVGGMMVDMQRRGQLPLRVTHNDTKLNNVMLDADTREPLCVTDLDTVMPGLAGNDFGDSIRFGASTAAEDEKDLSKVEMSLTLYEAYARGFLGACGSRLTQNEVATLPLGAKLMTLECGVRFLADYLDGDVYFHTARPEHNLDRARTQFKLVRDMEEKWDDMRRIVEGI